MSNVIDGEFRRVARRRKAMPLGSVSAAIDIPIGVQAWEYLHQGEVQTENVIITGTNNPRAMDDNIFYQMEQDTRQGVDVAVAAAQKVLDSGTSWLTIAAVVFVLFNIFNAGR